MDKKLLVLLTLTFLLALIDASPVKLIYDDLDSVVDYGDDYNIEEEDLDDFSKLIDAANTVAKKEGNNKIKTSGYKKKAAVNKGVLGKHDIEDLKKYFKLAGAFDKGSHFDDDVSFKLDTIGAGAAGNSVNNRRKFRKGSKTRGFHNVHHKDEYQKNREFYEDDENSGEVNKFGGGGVAVIGKSGAGYHRGHSHHDRQKGIYGKEGYSDKGSLNKQLKGFSDLSGFDGSFSNSK